MLNGVGVGQTAKRLPIVAEKNFILAAREVGYRTLADAIAELLDNGLQAGARRLDVSIFAEGNEGSVAVSDDGYGMDSDTLRGALQFGGTNRFNDRSGLGRFGMGLPCSSISQARRLEVFSWKNPRAIIHSYLDVDEIVRGTYGQIPRVRQTSLPNWISARAPHSGTIVHWTKCDRIDWSNPLLMEDKIRRQLGRMFRYFLWEGKRIVLNGRPVSAIDPLFCHKRSILHGAKQYGTPLVYQLRLPGNSKKTADVRVRFSELPVEAWHDMTNQQKREFGVVKGSGVSLVRARREIAYGWYFMGEKRKENYDDWWRCEVSFGPELDEYFNPTHTKQEICPGPVLDGVLSADLESLARTLNARVRDSFSKLKEKRRPAAVHMATTKSKYLPTSLTMQDKVRANRGEIVSASIDKNRSSAVRYTFSVRPVRDESFYSFRLCDGVLELVLNQDHPFFERIYAPLCAKGSKQLRASVDCLLLALVRAEAEAKDGVQRYWYTRKRTAWSNILATFLGS